MPAGGLRPQLVSPLAVGADEGGAEAELETTAALGKGAAVGVEGAMSEPPPPPQALRSTGRPSHKSRAPKGLLFLTATRWKVTVECMHKLSVCPMVLHAVCCNQTKARV